MFHWNCFEIAFDELLNGVFGLCIGPIGAELEGGVETPSPRPEEGGAEHRPGAG